ncbi:hypothetical protein D3C71_2178960 [compost metagenome]
MHRVNLNQERFNQQVIDECVRLQFIGDDNNVMTVAMAHELQDSKAQDFAVTPV